MSVKIIAKNKRAGFDYFLTEKFEAGIALMGTEVKALREGQINFNDAFVSIDDHGEVWLYNMSIPPYKFGNIMNHPETRKRKLLLNKREIGELRKGQNHKGLTIVPTSVYFKNSLVKVEIALAKGKKLHDKRDSIAERDSKRRLARKDFSE